MRDVVTVMLVLRVYLPQVFSFLPHKKLLVTCRWFRHESGWTDCGAVKVMDRPSLDTFLVSEICFLSGGVHIDIGVS